MKTVDRTHSFKVGDVLESSWGYEQTNIDLYQVIALNGKSMVTVRAINLPVKEMDATGPMSCDVSYVLPDGIVDSNAKPFRRKVQNWYKDKRPEGDQIEINEFASAVKYDGGKLYKSWYY